MKFTLAFLLFAGAVCLGVHADKLSCIHGKYKSDLGNKYDVCHSRSGAAGGVEKIKNCFRDYMKEANVVVTRNREISVDRTKFGEWAEANKNKPIGKAMKACYNENEAGSEFYKKAAKASQCVFLKVKETCK